jgi:hypothetical protein
MLEWRYRHARKAPLTIQILLVNLIASYLKYMLWFTGKMEQNFNAIF